MSDAVRKTWDEIARHWHLWGPPLRPAPEDLRIMRDAVTRWFAEEPADVVRLFLCGVTPEIATLSWPFRTHLRAVEQSEGMVRLVWPGDVPGLREAVVGDWLRPGTEDHSRDVALADGSFSFFDYPHGQRALAAVLRRVLRPRGLLAVRLYAQAPRRESVADVLAAARAGRVENFHAYKWRLSMALQADSRTGVRLHDVWQACTVARVETAGLPQPGWSPEAVGTIRFYEEREGRHYFPTLEEYVGLLSEAFERIEVRIPHYELGERCPIVTARARS